MKNQKQFDTIRHNLNTYCWANNPAMVAMMEALNKIQAEHEALVKVEELAVRIATHRNNISVSASKGYALAAANLHAKLNDLEDEQLNVLANLNAVRNQK